MSLSNQSDIKSESSSGGSRFLSLWARTTYSGFGLSRNARTKLLTEIADAATDLDVTFWLVTILSGAIATFGLLQNSAAVVIGAMLIAPLLGPLTGLALSVAVGDARLFVQTFLSLVLITVGLTGVAALITILMPITPLTDQIEMRTYPTVLDLFIAISSGAAAALVTGSGNRRLSASIPGVAVAVALVPPLGAAGYGLASGLQWDVFTNSLLLFWTNLAGIVLSGLLVYLLLGFGTNHLGSVLRDWHVQERESGVASWIGPLPRLQTIAFEQPARRVLITLLFVAITSIPLIKAFDQLVSDYYLDQAIGEVVTSIEAEPGAFVIERQIESVDEGREVTLTTISRQRIPSEVVDEATEAALTTAGGSVSFSVVQRVFANDADFERAANSAVRSIVATEASRASGGELASRLDSAASSLAIPNNTTIVSTELMARAEGGPNIRLVLAYENRRPLADDTLEIIATQMARTLEVEPSRVKIAAYRTGSFRVDQPDEIAMILSSLAGLEGFSVFLDRDDGSDALAQRLVDGGVPVERVLRSEQRNSNIVCVGLVGGSTCEKVKTPNDADEKVAAARSQKS